MTYLVATSRLLPNPLWLILQGESSTGKSTIANTVFRLIPEAQAEDLTRLSPKAPLHEGVDLKHKLLLIQEREGILGAQTALRTAKTEKRLNSLILQKGPDGRWKLERHHVQGPWAMITTTVPTRMDEQDSNRCIVAWTDSTSKHVEEILDAKKRMAAGEHLSPDEEAAILERHRSAQRMLEQLPVIIPYARSIRRFPADTPARARSFEQLCGLIEASTLLHQRYRNRLERGGRTYLVADITTDYALARRLFLPVLQMSVGNLGQTELELLSLCRAIEADSPDEPYPITRHVLERRTGLAINTLGDRTRRLEEAGLLRREPVCGAGQKTRWRVDLGNQFLETPEELLANCLHHEGVVQDQEVGQIQQEVPAPSTGMSVHLGKRVAEEEEEEERKPRPLRKGRFAKPRSLYGDAGR